MKATIKVKPLSVNQCWQGRRFKNRLYDDYEREVLYLLPKGKITWGSLVLTLKLGVSNRNSDIDNPIKPILDILQKKYGFNDKQIVKLEVEKKLVKKGQEFFEFEIKKSIYI